MLDYLIFKTSGPTSERTPHITITKVNWLMLFREIIGVYTENNKKPINTLCTVTDWWYIYLPLGFKGIKTRSVIQNAVSNGRIISKV
jgi:hypothetical protein